MLKSSPFLELVVGEYFRARRLRTEHHKVTRGESHSISAEIEDILAVEIANSWPAVDHIYVNQTITSTKDRLDGRMKPDLVLCKSDTLCLLIDLKMDVGYKRKEFTAAAMKRADEVRRLRGKKVSLWKKENNSRQRKEYRVAEDILYAYVVVSDGNISLNEYQEITTRVKELAELRLFTLVKGTHPNLYGMEEAAVKAKVLEYASSSDFEALSNLISSAVL